MAQKQYEMLFQLNAKLGSQYSSTLRSAQTELTRFSQEYRNLSATANDISAYQRQQSAVDNTKSKLQLLQQQYDNIQREMEESGSYSSDLENKLLSKRAQIEKTTAALQNQTDKLSQYKQRLDEAGINTSDLGKESDRLRAELEQLKNDFSSTGENADKFGEEGVDAVEELGSALAAAGITKLLKEIYDAYAECVSIAADFEESMSNVEAISGANAEELSTLTTYAKDLGASTKFTAQQVSEGMSYMAMAGWKVNDMLSGMDSVLALSAASGEDLGTTSDIVTDALTAFGLRASDTARFADVLAATATNANTNVGMMGETFKYAAPVAGALGYTIEDVSVAIGLMANAGIKGSNAGTALRNVFNGLLEGVTLTGDAIGELDYSAVKSDGTMKSFGETIDDLRLYFSQMTDAEKVNNAAVIAGQRGYAGLLSIINATDDDFEKLRGSIDASAGAAQRMADIKLDNLNGQITIAQSAAEGLKIAIGDQFTPALTKMYQTLGSVLSGVTGFIKQYPMVAKAITAITIGVGTFIAVLTGYIVVAKLAKAATKALTAAMDAHPFLMMGSVIAGVVTALVSLAAITSSAAEEEERLSDATIKQQRELELLRLEYEKVCKTEGETSAAATLLKQRIEEETKAFNDSKETMEEYIERRKEVVESYGKIAEEHRNEELGLEKEFDVTSNLINRLNELTAAEHKSAEAKKEIAAIVDILNGSIPELGLNYDELTGTLNLTPEKLLEIVEKQHMSDLTSERYNNLQETTKKLYELEAQQKEDAAALAAARITLDSYVGDESTVFGKEGYNSNNWKYVGPSLFKGSGYVNKQTGERIEGVQWTVAVQTEVQAVADAEARLEETNAALAAATAEQQELLALLTGTEGETSADMDVMGTVMDTYRERIDALTEAYNTAYEAAYQSISGQYKLWDDVADVTATSVDDVIGNLQKQQQYWDSYNTNIEMLLGYSGQIAGLSEMVASFGDGSAESVNMIAGMAEAARSGDPTKIQDLVTAWQNNKIAQDESAQSLADLTSGYSKEMDNISTEIAETVAEFELSEEAVVAGKNTIQGFIDGANNMLPTVRAAYASIGQAAIDAMNGKVGSGYPPTGYAIGTSYAKRGFAYVGENGPELLWFNGGESVMPAGETADYIRALREESREPVGVTGNRGGSTVQISFAPTYHISGDSDSEEIRAMLVAHDEELKRQIRELLIEETEDQVRRRM